MYIVKHSQEAERDIKNIAFYIAKENPYKAISFTQELLEKGKSLSFFPKKGIRCKNYYYLIHKNYLLFYDIKERKKEVEIIHIKNASQYTAYKSLL